jgi:5'(3')-deoxyribonucleotidase
MEKTEIIKLSKKNIDVENLEKAKKFLEKDYEISYGDYNSQELYKALDNSTPFFIKNNFITGYENKKFLSDNDEEIVIDKMVKAVIVESTKDSSDFNTDDRDFFTIIGKNNWGSDLSDFKAIFSDLKVGEIFLPPHSAIFNFLTPTQEEIKEKIVSCLEGVNVNVYSKDNYVDNCIHEVGHLFWRDCVKPGEKKKFKEHFDRLKPSAIYQYQWERSSEEEVFCTIYKWYVKSLLLNPSFYNILEFEDPEGLKLLQDVIDRKSKDIIASEIWELKKNDVIEYFNPKFDKTTGKKFRTQSISDIQDVQLPDTVLNNIRDFTDGTVYINLNKCVIPVKGNKIDVYVPMEKAKKDKPVIYMDMDGVVADFKKGYKDAFGRSTEKDDKNDPFTVNKFCLTKPDFFRFLPVIEQGLDLVNYLKDDYKIVFLTTPMKGMESCRRDKVDWMIDNLGEYDIIFSDNKAEMVVSHESILIDDMSYNLEPWKEAGGTAIKFPQKMDKVIDAIEKVFNDKEEITRIQKQLANMDINANPTMKQKESGIYKKGTIDFKGLNIKIENPKGSIRWGFDGSGKKWVTKMKCHYGYISGTEGADFDPIDCFIGPHLNKSLVFIVNQGKNGMFDEHKIMLGYETLEEAEKAYLSNYEKGWDGLDSIKQTNTKKLREWLSNGNLNEPF